MYFPIKLENSFLGQNKKNCAFAQFCINFRNSFPENYFAYPRFFEGLQCNFQLKLEIAPTGGPANSRTEAVIGPKGPIIFCGT